MVETRGNGDEDSYLYLFPCVLAKTWWVSLSSARWWSRVQRNFLIDDLVVSEGNPSLGGDPSEAPLLVVRW